MKLLHSAAYCELFLSFQIRFEDTQVYVFFSLLINGPSGLPYASVFMLNVNFFSLNHKTFLK